MLKLILSSNIRKFGFSALTKMSASVEDMTQKLKKGLEAEHVEVNDISPDMCASSFHAVVVSDQFVGKSRLQQQRMVNEILKEDLQNIHAFTQKTFTVESWKKKNAS